MDNLEEWLINTLSSESEGAFEFIFLSYYSKLTTYAAGILKDDSIAEDMVQDFFVKFWENRKKLQIQISLKAFLYHSIHNQCINYLAHAQVEKKYSTQSLKNYQELLSPVSPDYPVANLIVKELEGTIKLAIDKLPDQCREVFLSVRYEELSYSEAAEKLGISVNTLKTQLQRALNKLREKLKDYLPIVI
jgi:RNA polymerase sigma-70 factor, ECF subfamily